jgi:hypothetical protein
MSAHARAQSHARTRTRAVGECLSSSTTANAVLLVRTWRIVNLIGFLLQLLGQRGHGSVTQLDASRKPSVMRGVSGGMGRGEEGAGHMVFRTHGLSHPDSPNLRVHKHTRKRARVTVAPRSLVVPAPEVVASNPLAV